MFKNLKYKKSYKKLTLQERRMCDYLEKKQLSKLQLENRGIKSPYKVAFNIRRKGIDVHASDGMFSLCK